MEKMYFLKEALEFFNVQEWNCKGVQLNPTQKRILKENNLSPLRWTQFLNCESSMTVDEVHTVASIVKVPPFALLMSPSALTKHFGAITQN